MCVCDHMPGPVDHCQKISGPVPVETAMECVIVTGVEQDLQHQMLSLLIQTPSL